MKFRKPMLAKNLEGNERRLKYPCYVQPKLDGVRCVTDGQHFWSRNGKLFPMMNVRHLQIPLISTYLIDGELFIEDATFEEIISALKNASGSDRALAQRLRFNVFDTLSTAPFYVRKMQVNTAVKFAVMHGAKWKAVPTDRVHSREALEVFAKKMLYMGREGTIIRNEMGLYVSRRTHDVLKYKPLHSNEFEIVDVKEAKGKDKGTPIFVCCVGRPKDKLFFRARPMGSMKQRRRMWRERADLLGCMLTVEYQNLTKYGKPRFPRAKVLRDYE